MFDIEKIKEIVRNLGLPRSSIKVLTNVNFASCRCDVGLNVTKGQRYQLEQLLLLSRYINSEVCNRIYIGSLYRKVKIKPSQETLEQKLQNYISESSSVHRQDVLDGILYLQKIICNRTAALVIYSDRDKMLDEPPLGDWKPF
ncbi:hypothetical protein [Photobacterium kishitanii]|uniref:Uncharacterized protein n=1 Tax=Photobacterium kishitanii TaxID=318456 RepID=A0A2T3KLK7_9GAMM|nr:hypothetical protein [Photobacterium kishitanii]PSV00530.1 hypothetical protein C9J27_05190 [Photobacterium kishitanii]